MDAKTKSASSVIDGLIATIAFTHYEKRYNRKHCIAQGDRGGLR